ncbi:MAG: SPFH/Band 7/PHB domain protein, partial [Rhodospirillales bacterium]|nr:SPFH/Band 7/PHB domain protein [Rhodospirillales bacterium]
RRECAYGVGVAGARGAEAAAKATHDVSEAIAGGNVQAVNYFVALKYTEALEKMAAAPNQKVVFMPLEASSLIGTIGGIAELVKESFPDSGGSGGGGGGRRFPGSVPATDS